MHCNRAVSQQLLPGIIEGYRARGFRFVTIPQLLGGE
jgi:peptidoglycan/xylan/chitin deacetylase (PgdA/CDA1 family)